MPLRISKNRVQLDTVPLNLAAEVDVASAATVSIGATAVTSNNIRITGTTTITSLGTADAGVTRTLRFAASLTLTYNATSLILPGGASIVTAANDTAEMLSLGSGNWFCKVYANASGVPRMDVYGSSIYAKDSLPTVLSSTISPHVIGFWPLMNSQKVVAARDISGNRNHFYRDSYNLSLNRVAGNGTWLSFASSGNCGLVMVRDPVNPIADIGRPGASFIVSFEATMSAYANQYATVLGKGQYNIGGGIGITIGLGPNTGTSKPRIRIILNNTNYWTSDWTTVVPTWNFGDSIHVAVVRDSAGILGTANRIYVYYNGIRDTGFNGVGYLGYAPTGSYYTANLALFSYANCVSGLDGGMDGANNFKMRNLHLSILPPDIALPSTIGTLIAGMAVSPSHIPTFEELP